jgi:tRNA uridine 5-carboxymethylaminomethyl modification enzyme
VYPSGLSTSLPIDIQWAFYRSIEGLERVEIMRPAYAIEYDYVNPIQLHASLETKLLANLYHAGQINGTSGYEEAAAQGLMAGINAALRVQGKEPLVLGRSDAYIGVMIDDLVTLGTKEPYRMFTSRAEYRLLLREDNADLRLREKGHAIGLVPEELYADFIVKKELIDAQLEHLGKERLTPSAAGEELLQDWDLVGIQNAISYEQLLRRPDFTCQDLSRIYPEIMDLSETIREQLEIQIKYKGYIGRQLEQVERAVKLEGAKIPLDMDYAAISGLSAEVREKLARFRPDTLGQASRIPGVTPAGITILSIAVKAKGAR